MCALWNFGLAGWCLYPLARGCRAPRRKQPELAATAPAIPVWRYRLVAGAAELGGSVGDRGACNNAVRGYPPCVLSGISGWRDGVFIRWRVAAERRAGSNNRKQGDC